MIRQLQVEQIFLTNTNFFLINVSKINAIKSNPINLNLEESFIYNYGELR